MNHAKKSKNGNWVIPNSFQTPNFLVDELMAYLTPSETVVLVYAIRQILGYQDRIMDRRAHISLSNFANCGMSQQAIREALRSLDQFKILIAIDAPTPKGQLYELQENQDQIDFPGLKKRHEDKSKKASKRTEKATKASLKSRGYESEIDLRDKVFERDGGMCRYCGNRATQLDHIMPKSKGGKNTLENCVAACFGCNNRKRDNSPWEVGMTVLPIKGVTSDVTPTSDVTGNVGQNKDITSDVKQGITSDVDIKTQSLNPPSKPKEKRGAGKTRQRDPLLDHPAIMAYRDEAHLSVPVNWRQEVANVVDNPELWQSLIHEWIGRGWNKQNISGLLDAYKKGGIADRKNGYTPSEPAGYSGIREWLQDQEDA